VIPRVGSFNNPSPSDREREFLGQMSKLLAAAIEDCGSRPLDRLDELVHLRHVSASVRRE